ncbi:hypothetical protein KIH13_17610 [Pseudomonas viridiflava]|nr:hypothetical protein KIH13_17610 [Pseudomonas viridiflava]
MEELRSRSADFARMWGDGDVQDFGGAIKHLLHPVAGEIEMEYSAFSVDGRPNRQ